MYQNYLMSFDSKNSLKEIKELLKGFLKYELFSKKTINNFLKIKPHFKS